MDWFDELRHAQLAEYDRIDAGRAQLLRERDVVYLYGTIGSEAILLRDGSVRIGWAPDRPTSEDHTERVAGERERIGSIVLGMKRWPTLQRLLPARPADGGDCPQCAGSRYIMGSVLCPACDGLGWVLGAI